MDGEPTPFKLPPPEVLAVGVVALVVILGVAMLLEARTATTQTAAPCRGCQEKAAEYGNPLLRTDTGPGSVTIPVITDYSGPGPNTNG